MKLHADEGCVLHLSFSSARVYIAALDLDCSSCCIEVLILEFSDLTAVHCVCILSAELSYVELHDAAADLLVRSESDLDLAVLELWVLHDILHCIHDLSDTRFVIRSKKSGSVSCDDGLAFII